MSGVTCALAGGVGVRDQQTVTYGSASTGSNPVDNYFGYKGTGTPTCGSISDGTSNIYYGATINGIYMFERGYVSPPVGYVTRELVFSVNDVVDNLGWNTMVIGATSYNRLDATFVSSLPSTWTWTIPIPDPFTSGAPGPFNGSGTTEVVWI